MATKQTTQLCYQVNGGTCRNKVSAKNYYVCAAGHRATKNMSRNEIATQFSAKAIREIGWHAQCELATNPSIDRDIAQALFGIGDRWIRRALATNPSIARDMMQALFDTGGDGIRCNLARNPSIDRDMMQALFDTGGDGIRYNLAMNPSMDREMAITLAKDGHAPTGYLENKSITELCEGENISLLNEHPKEFGQTYLDHLLGSGEDLDQMKALLCYSYDCYRKAGGSNPKDYKKLILEKYPNDEEVKNVFLS